MSRTAYEEISEATAAEAARGAAFTCPFSGRVIVHSILNGWIGADWDLDELLTLIRSADGLYWQDGMAGHDLAVIAYAQPDGAKVQYNFEVPRPADSKVGAA